LALLGKRIHRQDLIEEVRAAESTSRLELQILWREALQILSGGAGASHREIHENPMRWCSVDVMMLVAALGGSGAVSCSTVEHMDGYPLRNAN
jgi:hypothetical protein